MTDMLIEGVKVAALLGVLIVAATLLWAMVVGAWRAVTGEHKRHQDREAKAWIAGWNAAHRGSLEDADEWARRMDTELDR